MSGWTEDAIRKVASWKAFKEGKSLADLGMVTQAVASASGWSGLVQSGRRPFRVRVVFKTLVDVEAHCSCPQNQSTGECCAHAVAVGLALLKPPAIAVVRPVNPVAPVAAVAWDVWLSPSWRKAIVRGQLPVLIAAGGRQPREVDRRISEWLLGQRCGSDSRLRLNLTGPALAAWIDLLIEHPLVRDESTQERIEFSGGAQLPVEDAFPDEVCLRLKPSVDFEPLLEVSGLQLQVGEAGVKRLGQGEIPGSLLPCWRSLVSGREVVVDLRALLGDLERWQDWILFPEGGWLQSLHFVHAPARFRLSLDGSAERVLATLEVAYDEGPWLGCGQGETEQLPRLVGDHCEIRNRRDEEIALRQFQAAGFGMQNRGEEPSMLLGQEAVLHFVVDHLPRLSKQWEVQESQSFRALKASLRVVMPDLEILGSGDDWLSFNVKFKTIDGNILSRQQTRDLLSGAKGSRGSGGLVLPSEYKRVLEPLLADLELEQRDGHYECSARAGEVIQEICKKAGKSNNSNNQYRLNNIDLPASFHADLRPYQKEGVTWMWDRIRRYQGALLADDMGLGKTVQTIALVERWMDELLSDSGVVLVVMTASLLGNWRQEWQRFAPSRRVHVLHGTQRDTLRGEVVAGDVVLTTYSTLTRDLAWHLGRRYRAVVADEASLMRNPDTDHAKAMAKLDASAKIALTGTPLENSVRDLWSIFRFVQPGWLGARKAFEERYAGGADGKVSAADVERLRLKVCPFVLRRTKLEVAPELPAKWQIDEYCDLSEEQQKVYRELLDEGRRRVEALEDVKQAGAARMQVLTALLRLRQVCNDLALLGGERFVDWSLAKRSAKLSRLMELLESALAGGHKVLVFSQFQKQLLEIESALKARDWGCLRLDGQTVNRQHLVDRFQSPDGPPIFLISLKAGGYGLNLTAADTVIHFDPWWNPAAEAQATDRAHRIGQTRPVTVYRLLTRGTVEERVVSLQARKRGLAAIVDETGETDVSGISQQELEALLRP